MKKEVILTGLRANNDLHIGNYFGAMLPMVDMARQKAGSHQVNMFVPDLHSFTTPIDHSQLQAQITNNLKLFAAAGLPLDNDDIFIYRQSYVPAHSELTWILDCFTGFGEMRRMTQFKDKAEVSEEKGRHLKSKYSKAIDSVINSLEPEKMTDELKQTLRELINKAIISDADERTISSVGLFNYPVLMAADILLYGAAYIPVGDDQTQHLEFARDIAERMNNKFGKELFIVPHSVKAQHEFFGKDQGLRIKDLIDPAKKMSKSDESDKGIIFLGDEPEAAAKKIMGATTDSIGKINFDREKQPGITNLLQILALFSNRAQKDVNAEWEGREQYGELKKAVAEAVREFLKNFQAALGNVDEQTLERKLETSEAVMNKQADATLLGVQQAVGLRPRL